MTLYWMLNSHWPSFYGNLIDYYLSPGGAYYGAKKGLRPLSVVFRCIRHRRSQAGQDHRLQSNPRAMCKACVCGCASTI